MEVFFDYVEESCLDVKEEGQGGCSTSPCIFDLGCNQMHSVGGSAARLSVELGGREEVVLVCNKEKVVGN